MRLYSAEELTVLNGRRDTQRAKKQAQRAVEDARIAAEQAASTAARKMALEADPFYQSFKALVGTFSAATVYDAGWDAEDTRPALPDFLRDMWKRIQHADLTDNMRAAVQKFIDTRKAQEDRKANSHFVGEIGKRIEIKATVVFTMVVHYGVGYSDPDKHLIKFELEDRSLLTWFTQKCYRKGDKVTGKATVKDHKEYKGQKETQITNFRITDVIEAPEAA